MSILSIAGVIREYDNTLSVGMAQKKKYSKGERERSRFTQKYQMAREIRKKQGVIDKNN